MNNLTKDQQKVADEVMNLVMQRVYTRIAPVLTEEDMVEIEKLNKEDESGNSVRYFLVSKVPNFDQIFQEEADLIKNNL